MMHCIQSTSLWICIFLNAVAALFAIPSLICIISVNKNLERVVRGILISFYASNLVGIAAITHDTLFTVCETQTNVPLVRVSLLLSLSHLSLLMLAEYAFLAKGTSRKQHYGRKSFLGLIVLAWILSVTVGVMIIAPGEDSSTARRIFGASFLVMWLAVSTLVHPIITKYRRKKRIAKMANLQPSRKTSKASKAGHGGWTDQELRLMILLSNMFLFLCCCLLWIVNEFLNDKDLRGFALMLCSCHFFAPCVSAACLWYRARKAQQIVLPL